MEKPTAPVQEVVDSVTTFSKTREAFSGINRGHDFAALLEHTPTIAEMIKSQKTAEGRRMTFAARDDDGWLGADDDLSNKRFSKQAQSAGARLAYWSAITLGVFLTGVVSFDIVAHAIIPYILAHGIVLLGVIGGVALAATLMVFLLKGIKGKNRK